MSGDLIGSRISLISRKDIRWEGILVQVDRENASVTLQSVKSWGTEGRAEGIMQIPPAEQLHEMVMFRGEDIKDLHVHETAEPTPVAPMPSPTVMAPPPAHMNNATVASKASIEMPPPQVTTTTAHPTITTTASTVATSSTGAAATVAVAAPASVSSSASAPVAAAHPNPVAPPPARLSAFVAPDAAAGGGGGGGVGGGLSSVATVTEPGEATSNNGETKAGEGSPPQTMRDQGQKPGRYQPPHRNPHWKPPQSNPRPASGSGASALPGQGNHLLNRRTRGAGSGPLNEDGEFDFEAGLAKFDKEKEMALLAGSMSATSIQSHGGSSMTSEGFINGEETEEQEAAAGDMGAGGVAAAAAAAAVTAAASAGERRTAADGGEIWVEPAVVVKKYNKSSFFDEISCDALDGRGRMPGGYGRERTRNTETFGATSVALSSASRRYGGRGGGGYSNYSGGGARRGGYGDNGYRGRPYNGDRGAGGGGGSGGGGIGGDRQDSSGSWRRN